MHINKRIGFSTQRQQERGVLPKNWIVPYVVEDVLEKGTCRLIGLKNAVNGCRLKLYVTRDESSTQTTKEKRKEQVTDEGVTPEKIWRSDIDVEENTGSNFPSSGDENPSEPLRSTKDSDSSDPTVVGHYEGKTLVDLIPTGEQWQREKSVMKRKNQ